LPRTLILLFKYIEKGEETDLYNFKEIIELKRKNSDYCSIKEEKTINNLSYERVDYRILSNL